MFQCCLRNEYNPNCWKRPNVQGEGVFVFRGNRGNIIRSRCDRWGINLAISEAKFSYTLIFPRIPARDVRRISRTRCEGNEENYPLCIVVALVLHSQESRTSEYILFYFVLYILYSAVTRKTMYKIIYHSGDETNRVFILIRRKMESDQEYTNYNSAVPSCVTVMKSYTNFIQEWADNKG